MVHNPIVMIHGYSDKGESFQTWKRELEARGYEKIHICSYRTLTNEVSIRDLAEGFDRALRIYEGLNNDEPFDAIVHSTGILVIRAWLTLYKGRRDRLKRLIALAPASFGSPLAHKGRSWLGAIFKGNKDIWGPDFLESGDRVLDGLELASSFTWDLAHKDLLNPNEVYYGTDDTTPYVFVFCGTEGYQGIESVANSPGTDGTVRWAGCSLNTRKITLDLTLDPKRSDEEDRVRIQACPPNINIPLVAIAGLNHSTILNHPSSELLDLVDLALKVSSPENFQKWHLEAKNKTQNARQNLVAKRQEWQQFIVRVVDERNDPIPDYHIKLFSKNNGDNSKILIEFDVDVHPYSGDSSYRCFHVNLSEIQPDKLSNLWMRVIASSGSKLVGYYGFGSHKIKQDATAVDERGKWDGELDLTALLHNERLKFFHPFTTTLVELRLNREPLPISGKNEVCWFLDLEWSTEAKEKLLEFRQHVEQFAKESGIGQITEEIYKQALEKFKGS